MNFWGELWSKISKSKMLTKIQQFQKGHIYNFHASQIHNLGKTKQKINKIPHFYPLWGAYWYVLCPVLCSFHLSNGLPSKSQLFPPFKDPRLSHACKGQGCQVQLLSWVEVDEGNSQVHRYTANNIMSKEKVSCFIMSCTMSKNYTAASYSSCSDLCKTAGYS